jgi:hypothetical protein
MSDGTTSQNLMGMKEGKLDIPTIPEISSNKDENQEDEPPQVTSKLNITD